MSRFLVTGSEGFIGRWLVGRLLDDGHQVVGVSRRPAATIGRAGYVYRAVDATDGTALPAAIGDARFDVVVHAAGPTTRAELTADPRRTHRTTALGALNALEAMRRTGARRLVYLSSGKVYGAVERLPLAEDHPTAPTNVLGRTKLLAERILGTFASEGGESFVIVRLFNVYGPGQRTDFLVPTILAQLAGGGAVVRLGDIESARDYVFVGDAVDALLHLATADLAPGMSVFNVGSGVPSTAKDIVETVGGLLGYRIAIETDPGRYRRDEHPMEYADVGKLERSGWTCRYDLREGLSETVRASLAGP